MRIIVCVVAVLASVTCLECNDEDDDPDLEVFDEFLQPHDDFHAFFNLTKKKQINVLNSVRTEVGNVVYAIKCQMKNIQDENKHIKSEIENIRRENEFPYFKSAMVSMRNTINDVYTHEVVRHAKQLVVKREGSATTTRKPVQHNEKLRKDKSMWTNFLRDNPDGIGRELQKLLVKNHFSIDKFAECMPKIFDFASSCARGEVELIKSYNLLACRLRHKSFLQMLKDDVETGKNYWPFTKKHLDFVNFLRESLKQSPFTMLWINKEMNLVLPMEKSHRPK